ncbi:MAG: hypothetical protein IPO24_00115 [Bacteroidetes bacterium]|nr:hypothetical protein [Bacteroidota bacterium]
MSGIWDSGAQVITILKLAQGMYLIQLDAEDVNYKCTFIKL